MLLPEFPFSQAKIWSMSIYFTNLCLSIFNSLRYSPIQSMPELGFPSPLATSLHPHERSQMFLGKSPWGAPRKNPQDAPAVSVGFGLDEALLGCDARVHVQQGWNLLLDRQRGTPRGENIKAEKTDCSSKYVNILFYCSNIWFLAINIVLLANWLAKTWELDSKLMWFEAIFQVFLLRWMTTSMLTSPFKNNERTNDKHGNWQNCC